MCEIELKQKYEALAQGRTVLESRLHTNLSEHINSEIGLGTIRDVNTAKTWLRNSFLFQRIQQNPRHYAIGKAGDQTWQERIDEMVTQSVQKLQDNELVALSETDSLKLASTEYGEIMSKVRAVPVSLYGGTHLRTVLYSPVNGTIVYFSGRIPSHVSCPDECNVETVRSRKFERHGKSSDLVGMIIPLTGSASSRCCARRKSTFVIFLLQ